MRLIDADALLSEFLRRYTERERIGELVFAACEIKQNFADMVTDSPTIEAEPVKHGRWEEGEKNRFWGTKGNYVCSNCKSAVGFVKFNYCPNCGAKMIGDAE